MKYLILLFAVFFCSLDVGAISGNNTTESRKGGKITATEVPQADGSFKRALDVTIRQDVNDPTNGAAFFFSDFQATFADEAIIDTGFLDMGNIDKIQITLEGSAGGLTVELSSRADPLQNAKVTSGPVEPSFFLASLPIRQRYIRFRIINETGNPITNLSFELKGTYGSSDKMSVFAINNTPTPFSQAALVQSINKGTTAGGDYVLHKVNEAGAALVSGFGTEVARGLYTSYSVKNKFGHNVQIDTGTVPESIWDGGGIYTGFNATANELIEAFSSDAADVGALVSSGTAVSGTATQLLDTGATFVSDGVAVGDILLNDTKGYHGYIKAVTETLITVFRMNDGAGFVHVNAASDAYRVATASSTGAAVVKLTGLLDTSCVLYTSEYIILSGVTGVDTTGSYHRNSRSRVVHAGTSGLNEGTITVRQSVTTANVYTVMGLIGQSAVAADTVPSGQTGIIKRIRASITKTGGASGSGTVIFYVREHGGSWNAREIFQIQAGANVDQSFTGGIVLNSGTDFKLEINDVSGSSTMADGSFEYFFIDEATTPVPITGMGI